MRRSRMSCCFLGQKLSPTLLISTRVCKWVPAKYPSRKAGLGVGVGLVMLLVAKQELHASLMTTLVECFPVSR